MATVYWYRTCPHCDGQGRLIITKDVTANRLYLHCDECEWGWRDPERVDNADAKFLTLNESFGAEDATREDIGRHGWGKYALHHFEAE